ncbi:hypothetical protein LX36DRAFT_754050 [Colletotrichum falcatum]|nr:hypothetical protein LX36DRAFT_754050 [Colletotrichum falcatum]
MSRHGNRSVSNVFTVTDVFNVSTLGAFVEINLDAFYQHRLDASQKSATLRHVLRKNTNLFLRDSIGDSILHTLAGDFGPLDLSSETEGFEILTQFFDIGTSGFGPLVKSCCLSMINSQNDGHHITEEGVAEPFMHTPLGVAILYNNLKCAELLLQHGADPNIPGEWGRTPLFFADRNSSEEAVRLLVDYGAHM